MKLMVSSFLASGFIAVIPPNAQAFDNPTKSAWRYAGKAIAVELDLSKYGKELEKKYLPRPLVKYGLYIGIATRLATEQKVSYTWEF